MCGGGAMLVFADVHRMTSAVTISCVAAIRDKLYTHASVLLHSFRSRSSLYIQHPISACGACL